MNFLMVQTDFAGSNKFELVRTKPQPSPEKIGSAGGLHLANGQSRRPIYFNR
jgi:hypothetical protein